MNIAESMRLGDRQGDMVFTDLEAKQEFEWQEPKPLQASKPDLLEYPVNALPEIIRDAVLQYQQYGQQPTALIANSALAALAVSVQGLANIRRDSQGVIPLSLSLVVVAESGERKSTADKVFMHPVRHWQSEKAKATAILFDEYKAEIKMHEAELSGHYAKVKKGQTDSELTDRIKELESNPPQRPQRPILLYEDITTEALALSLSREWPSAALSSDEAGMIIGGYSMKAENVTGFMAMLNKLWDGSDFNAIRKTSESAHIKGRRLTVNLAMQDKVLRQLTGAGDGMARGIGLLSRILLAVPQSTQGNRLYLEPPLSLPQVDAYRERIKYLLDIELPVNDSGELEPPELKLSAEAKAYWVEFYDGIESNTGHGGNYGDYQDIASKTAENALRLAGLFHILEHGVDVDVSQANIERGCRLAIWYLESAKAYYSRAKENQRIDDLEHFEHWLIEHCDNTNTLSLSHILQYVAPTKFRNRQARNEAIETLTRLGHVKTFTQKSTGYLKINPKLWEN